MCMVCQVLFLRYNNCMIGTVKIEFGAMNLYVNGVCVATTSTMAGIKHAAKRYNLQGYILLIG